MQGVSKRPLHLNTQRNWFLRRKICGIVKILAIQVFQLSRTFSWRSSASLRPTPSFCQTRPRRDCRNPSIRARFSLQRFLLTRLSNQNATATGMVVYKVVAGFRTSEPPHPPIPGCPDAVGGAPRRGGRGVHFPAFTPKRAPVSLIHPLRGSPPTGAVRGIPQSPDAVFESCWRRLRLLGDKWGAGRGLPSKWRYTSEPACRPPHVEFHALNPHLVGDESLPCCHQASAHVRHGKY